MAFRDIISGNIFDPQNSLKTHSEAWLNVIPANVGERVSVYISQPVPWKPFLHWKLFKMISFVGSPEDSRSARRPCLDSGGGRELEVNQALLWGGPHQNRNFSQDKNNAILGIPLDGQNSAFLLLDLLQIHETSLTAKAKARWFHMKYFLNKMLNNI